MSSRPTGRDEIATILAQRRELGGDPLLFEKTLRSEVLARARSAPVPTAPRRAGDGGDPGRDGAPSSPEGTSGNEIGGAELGYEELGALAAACTRCRLSGHRTNVVFSDGVPNARLMVVGEAPGAQEDRTGLPFVGPAGKLLDLLLASVDLSRERSAHICNVIKCRPPGNRNPLQDEIEACSPFLRGQIQLVRPEVLLAVGTFAAHFLTGSEKALGKLRGEVYSYEGTPVVVTYHPAALLRNPGWIRPAWDDLQLLRSLLDSNVHRDPS